MRLVWFLIFTSIMLIQTAFGEKEVLPDFKLMRQDENWQEFDREKTSNSLLKLKRIRLTDNINITIGGELRERYEYYSNYVWGAPLNQGDSYYLHRIMAHSDLQLSDDFRFFLQLKSNTVSDKELEPRPIDKDELDLHQAFLDWNSKKIVFRFGRQEFAYGSSRLVSVREGPNVRQSFDAAKLMFEQDGFKIDFFASRPVETNPGVFDDGSDYNREFHGMYSTFAKHFDFYWLLFERDEGEYHSGINNESRHTIGARWFSHKDSTLDHDYEAAIQKGSFGSQQINAWTIATNTGFTFVRFPWKPRIGIKADIASGDRNNGDDSLNTFNALFPKGAYFNEAAIIGPANIMDLHPALTIEPRDSLLLSFDWDFMWRQSMKDGLYNIPVDPTVAPGSSKEKYIGSQLALTAEWEFTRNLSFLTQYMHFNAGPFLKDTTPGKDLDFYTMWLTFKF